MLLVVGWDGAAWELADRFLAAGCMPTLSRLMAGGQALEVDSTLPPVTFPAWTSFMTGASPARHGITDFTARRAGTYGVRFLNSTHRRLPTIWRAMAAAGRRVGVYAMPATYPAEGVCEVEVCGFDTPLGASMGRGFCHPPQLAGAITARYGGLAVEGVPQGRIEPGWHDDALGRLIGSIRLRTRIVADLLREGAFDVFAVHFMESDTVAHHFWQFHDGSSPVHSDDGPASAIQDIYRELDRSLAELLAASGGEAALLLLSDHGNGGASDRVIAWNRVLADAGLLAFLPAAAGSRLARSLKHAAMMAVPVSWQAPLFGALPGLAARVESASRFAGIDWGRTRAYSEELPYQAAVWLNLAGREPQGIVAGDDAEVVIRQISAALLALRDPFDGQGVVTRVLRREQVAEGPYAHQIPDLLLELRQPQGYSYGAISSKAGTETASVRRLRPHERSGAKGSATSGMHRMTGMGLLCAQDVPMRTQRVRCTLQDCAVTALALTGLSPSPQMEGRSLLDFPGVLTASPLTPTLTPVQEYSAEQEREVEQRLRALGYLP
ncbi:MAG TPA: alkaline phosphatase family protein [Candidatus Binatia bacterium]|nr:alkaline phosphatase family protein [Candidatus Binatia bacterium]